MIYYLRNARSFRLHSILIEISADFPNKIAKRGFCCPIVFWSYKYRTHAVEDINLFLVWSPVFEDRSSTVSPVAWRREYQFRDRLSSFSQWSWHVAYWLSCSSSPSSDPSWRPWRHSKQRTSCAAAPHQHVSSKVLIDFATFRVYHNVCILFSSAGYRQQKPRQSLPFSIELDWYERPLLQGGMYPRISEIPSCAERHHNG